MNKLQAELVSKKDSIAILNAQLKTQPAVENTAKAQEIQPKEETPAILKTVSGNSPTYKLYKKPIISEIKDSEFAEVISSTDTMATFMADEFRVTAASVCNGPADPDLDYCNCSNFVYVVTATDGEYSDYQLFKVGPFVEPQFKGWKKDKERPELIIEHDVKGKKKTDTFRITLSGVKQI
ncbi:hypothetical protein EFB08_09600 [Rufibacter latericius]|uniref:Uncharacterized protein n=2 Tax=Rufibacter latericius TaxID=2487040 RepID=A0A3M9MVS7_9BACT|nr:hypothetical protein EFB08_09600 [Rufibacter latericius]